MSSGAAEQEQGIRRGSAARIRGIENAMGRLESAQKEWKPYQKLGTDAMSYFEQYKTPGGISTLYEKMASTTDPLNKYLTERKERAINRQMAARGKYGSGAAVEAQALGSSELQAQMGGLIEQRVQSELGLQERMLDRGERATGQVSDLYKGLAGLESDIGAAQGTMEEGIGASRRAGKQFETGMLVSGASGIFGAMSMLPGPMGMMGTVGQKIMQPIQGQIAPQQQGGATGTTTPNYQQYQYPIGPNPSPSSGGAPAIPNMVQPTGAPATTMIPNMPNMNYIPSANAAVGQSGFYMPMFGG